ncbi:hypothetical protein OH76DRAFT_1487753 [Lentinus brumalis]|uniref:Uncharacterized protein n=1 Tax=Lentinus brumalis TaxID=2498619 RepID=A0A371CTL6_9APHY|nr:hypothetical protein OH76DRAFT_1487753 [Polyporus brumalis]
MHLPVVSAYARSSYKSVTGRLWPRRPLPAPKGAAAAHAGGGEGHSSSGEGHGGFSSGYGRGGGSSHPDAAGVTSSINGGIVEPVPVPAYAPGLGKASAIATGNGVSAVSTISEGQPFAGRKYGGGTRDDVYGSSSYGSGYPGVKGLGTAGRDFPFGFWPVAWGASAGAASAAYLHTDEYGEPSNTTRPGGPEMRAVYTSGDKTYNNTLHIISDNATVQWLMHFIEKEPLPGYDDEGCWSMFNLSSHGPFPFNGNGTDPRPEQAIQYYRASTVVLTLEGYNNTAALTGDPNATAVPLPSVDMKMLNCVNETIGRRVIMFGSASSVSPPGVAGLVVFVYALLCLFTLF